MESTVIQWLFVHGLLDKVVQYLGGPYAATALRTCCKDGVKFVPKFERKLYKNELLCMAAADGNTQLCEFAIVKGGARRFDEAMFRAAANGHTSTCSFLIDIARWGRYCIPFEQMMMGAALGGHCELFSVALAVYRSAHYQTLGRSIYPIQFVFIWALIGRRWTICDWCMKEHKCVVDEYVISVVSQSEGSFDVIKKLVEDGHYTGTLDEVMENSSSVEMCQWAYDHGARSYAGTVIKACNRGNIDIVRLVQLWHDVPAYLRSIHPYVHDLATAKFVCEEIRVKPRYEDVYYVCELGRPSEVTLYYASLIPNLNMSTLMCRALYSGDDTVVRYALQNGAKPMLLMAQEFLNRFLDEKIHDDDEFNFLRPFNYEDVSALADQDRKNKRRIEELNQLCKEWKEEASIYTQVRFLLRNRTK